MVHIFILALWKYSFLIKLKLIASNTYWNRTLFKLFNYSWTWPRLYAKIVLYFEIWALFNASTLSPCSSRSKFILTLVADSIEDNIVENGVDISTVASVSIPGRTIDYFLSGQKLKFLARVSYFLQSCYIVIWSKRVAAPTEALILNWSRNCFPVYVKRLQKPTIIYRILWALFD